MSENVNDIIPTKDVGVNCVVSYLLSVADAQQNLRLPVLTLFVANRVGFLQGNIYGEVGIRKSFSQRIPVGIYHRVILEVCYNLEEYKGTRD